MKDEDVIEELHTFDISCHGNTHDTCVLWHVLVCGTSKSKTFEDQGRVSLWVLFWSRESLVSGWGGLDSLTNIHPIRNKVRSKTKTVQQVRRSHQPLGTITWTDSLRSPLGSEAPSWEPLCLLISCLLALQLIMAFHTEHDDRGKAAFLLVRQRQRAITVPHASSALLSRSCLLWLWLVTGKTQRNE